MGYTDISFEVRDRVAVVTLDRPEHMNTFTGAMGKDLEHAYERVDEDDGIRAMVLTGAGRAFCAGADMTAGAETFAGQDGGESFSAAAVGKPLFALRKPVIAAVNGHAVGLGLTMALQADIRVMAAEGKYGVLQVRRGVMPDAYAHWTLQRIVGLSRAADILLTGRTFRGEEAYQLGVASRVVPAADVLATALEMATEIATQTAPLSVAVTKRLLWESANRTPEEVEHLETELHHHLMNGSDAIEGPMAYLERRSPEWKQSASGDWPAWPDVSERKGGDGGGRSRG